MKWKGMINEIKKWKGTNGKWKILPAERNVIARKVIGKKREGIFHSMTRSDEACIVSGFLYVPNLYVPTLYATLVSR